MKTLMIGCSSLVLLAMPATANAQWVSGVDNTTVVSGAVGAGAGALLGSQIAGSGNRTEGAAIGAVAGGLAGAAYGNSRSTYAGNPYAGSYNPGFTTRSTIGTGAGAVIGGAIGSNLAGSGQRQEGTAIGAVLGGVAGYTLANRTDPRRSSIRYGSYPQTYSQTYHTGPTYKTGYTTSGSYHSGSGYTYPQAPYYTHNTYVTRSYPTTTQHHTVVNQPKPIITQPVAQTCGAAPVVTHHKKRALPQPSSLYCYAGSDKRYDYRGRRVR